MKYAFVLCLLPLLASAQHQGGKFSDKFSVEFSAGILSSKMSSFHVIVCDLCPENYYRLETAIVPYYAGTLNYALRNRHRIGVGLALTRHGFDVSYQYIDGMFGHPREVSSKFMVMKLQHEYDLLAGDKLRLAVSNSFDFENRIGSYGNHMTFDEESNEDFAISHLLRISASWQFLPNTELLFGPALRTNLTKHHDYSYWGSTFHRFGYGALAGLKYKF